MNKIFLMGRLTRDPEYKTAANTGKPYAKYRLAVDRGGREGGADYFDCITYDAGANFAQTYLHKGTKIIVEGSMKYEEYTDKEGKKKSYYTVSVQRHEFAESTGDAPLKVEKKKPAPKASDDDFLDIPDSAVDDPGLPWS